MNIHWIQIRKKIWMSFCQKTETVVLLCTVPLRNKTCIKCMKAAKFQSVWLSNVAKLSIRKSFGTLLLSYHVHIVGCPHILTPEKDFQAVLKWLCKLLSDSGRESRFSTCSVYSAGGALVTSTGDIVLSHKRMQWSGMSCCTSGGV